MDEQKRLRNQILPLIEKKYNSWMKDSLSGYVNVNQTDVDEAQKMWSDFLIQKNIKSIEDNAMISAWLSEKL
ncbi:16945_t:CDS:2 [Cetraspora pellucida]|uniref:16945_t:CDS:1 n=1 Tax=Cetraspora pellucida TaxID=1433469 RepID=A0A9N8Z7I8_9GLOM|nr:16945_t:CDS:2 [Cetraspora pellucida]